MAEQDERREYTTRRRLAIPGVGVFNKGERCMLTQDQYAANANSLVPVAPPLTEEKEMAASKDAESVEKARGKRQEEEEGTKAPRQQGTKGATKSGAPDDNKDRMDTDLKTR